MKSDREIVESVLQGDINQYARLIERYENALYGFIIQIVRNRHTACEISQEVFVRAYEKIHSLRNTSAFGAWIFVIARREALRTERIAKKKSSLDPLVFPSHSEQDPRRNCEHNFLFDTLKRLPKHEQTTIYLKHFGGYTSQEIAMMNGCPAGTITKQLSRAYARLRVWLKEMEP